MPDLFLGLLALVVGALVCFRGYLAMRIIISVWGAFAGFALGAGIVDRVGDAGFLRSLGAWIAAIVLAAVFSALAYLYYEVSVTIAMGAIGFTLGSSATVALGATWSWFIILVGVAAGAALAAMAILGDLPTLLLAVLTALSGASTTVFGVMLLVGTLDTADFDTGATTEQLGDHWGWYVLYLVLAVAGLVSQLKDIERIRGSLRDEWDTTGGKQLRGSSAN